jgi:CRISPR-associated protein Csm3
MRSLFELSKGEIGGRVGGRVQNGPSPNGSSARLFGNATANNLQRPSRLIVRDAFLINADDLLEKTEIPYVEIKTEVVIDRITSAAIPRTFERVPAGARFGLRMVLNIFENDLAPEDELLQSLASSLALLQDDYIGGSGSRGYGQVKISLDSILVRTSEDFYLNSQEPREAEADGNIQKYFLKFLKQKEK